MAEIIFKDSGYRFTDPVRFFKANDPYYWEVDNLPLKQLAENTKWLKDQIGNLSITDITRRDIAELKPYVTGDDNLVRVKPGRFTARINDAYKLTPLQIFERVIGEALGDMDAWKVAASNHSDISAILDRIKTRVSDGFLGMNGLEVKSFTHPVINEDKSGKEYVVEFDPETGQGPSVKGFIGIKKPVFPLSEMLFWAASKGEPDYIVKAFVQEDISQGFMSLSVAESHAIKRWRGIARTAIVDVPNELSISIPAFNNLLHSYLDENGVGQIPDGITTRIDLLFLYSKSIDTSSAHTGKYVNGVPTKITKAELGLVVGAGRGISFRKRSAIIDLQPQSGIDAEGTPLMVPNASDELMTDAGFTKLGVYGSFPAPDDLMNIAPLIAEGLETDNPMLVGQSILPLAYIVAKNTDTATSKGVHIVTEASIIDIRPLFRTTELAYNERAGIAAAMPQLSLVNPAVGKAQLDWQIRQQHLDANSKIRSLDMRVSQGERQTTPRVVATGYIFGGWAFGVESAFVDYLSTKNSGGTTAQLLAELVNLTSLPGGTSIPELPQWDLSRWAAEGAVSERGEHPNDYINTHVMNSGSNPADFGCFVNRAKTIRATEFGTDKITNARGHVNIHYVSKTISINKDKVQWMGDYNVDVALWNCVPLSNRASSKNNSAAAGSAGVWVDKRDGEFTIYVSWTANDTYQDGDEHGGLVGVKTPINNRDGSDYAGFAVINEDLSRFDNATTLFKGETQAGVAIYPTVTFSITGIPKEYKGHSVGVGANTILDLV